MLVFVLLILSYYRFRKQTQYITLEEYDTWSVGYEETLQRRRKKWDQLMKEHGLVYGDEVPVRFPPPSAKIKRYVRKGIPPEWRGNVRKLTVLAETELSANRPLIGLVLVCWRAIKNEQKPGTIPEATEGTRPMPRLGNNRERYVLTVLVCLDEGAYIGWL